MITSDEKRATLLTLYPLFKEEVYRRRHEMIRWTVIGAGSLFTILLVLLLSPTSRQLSLSARVLVCCSIVLLTATFMTAILQQRQRHQQAKHTLIELEQSLGLFETDVFLDHRPLYPDHWQTDWQHDRSTILAFLLLGLLALLNIIATAFFF